MSTIQQLKKGGDNILPITTTDAVVDIQLDGSIITQETINNTLIDTININKKAAYTNTDQYKRIIKRSLSNSTFPNNYTTCCWFRIVNNVHTKNIDTIGENLYKIKVPKHFSRMHGTSEGDGISFSHDFFYYPPDTLITDITVKIETGILTEAPEYTKATGMTNSNGILKYIEVYTSLKLDLGGAVAYLQMIPVDSIYYDKINKKKLLPTTYFYKNSKGILKCIEINQSVIRLPDPVIQIDTIDNFISIVSIKAITDTFNNKEQLEVEVLCKGGKHKNKDTLSYEYPNNNKKYFKRCKKYVWAGIDIIHINDLFSVSRIPSQNLAIALKDESYYTINTRIGVIRVRNRYLKCRKNTTNKNGILVHKKKFKHNYMSEWNYYKIYATPKSGTQDGTILKLIKLK